MTRHQGEPGVGQLPEFWRERRRAGRYRCAARRSAAARCGRRRCRRSIPRGWRVAPATRYSGGRTREPHRSGAQSRRIGQNARPFPAPARRRRSRHRCSTAADSVRRLGTWRTSRRHHGHRAPLSPARPSRGYRAARNVRWPASRWRPARPRCRWRRSRVRGAIWPALGGKDARQGRRRAPRTGRPSPSCVARSP